ncbi:MAG TPA: tripartite tricarboxylate transporter substrate binding protein [Ramlibacter sp.]|nr:tripartite tricarboxylate transporter substrate binding protein [Ramlibacter sp.]
MKGLLTRCLAACAMALAAAGTASAQDKYPSKPVRVIVPFAAGGATDVLTRVVAAELGKRLGQNFLVENLTGAGGLIGAGQAIKAKPDGYTLLAGSPGPITIMPVISRQPVPFDVEKDVIPITLIADSPGAMVVGKNSPYRNVQQVIAAAKANPGKVTCGSSGVGAFSHLNCELLKSLAGINVTHVPYRGAAPALVDLVGGQFDFMIENYPSPQKLIDTGEARLLGVTARSRFALKPEAPLLVESGVPGHVMTAWIGLMAPAGTPADIVNQLQRETAAILKDPAVGKRMADMGVVPGGMPPAEFGQYLAAERNTYKELSAKTGLKVDQ